MLLLVRLIAADEWDEMNADAREASMPIMRIRKNTERMWGGSNHATTQAGMCTVYKHSGKKCHRRAIRNWTDESVSISVTRSTTFKTSAVYLLRSYQCRVESSAVYLAT